MLETERLYLSVPSEAHMEAIFKVHADPSTQQYNPSGPVKKIEDFRETYEVWKKHHDAHQFGYYILIDKSTDEPFGVCGLQFTKLQGETVLNIYYRIATEKTRKGYVKEAITCIMEHVLMITENQYRMLILTKVNNVPSIKTAESLGFIYDPSLDDYEEKGNVYFFNR